MAMPKEENNRGTGLFRTGDEMKDTTQAENVTRAEFIWVDQGLNCAEDLSIVLTKVLRNEIQVRRMNGYGSLLDGIILPMTSRQSNSFFNKVVQAMQQWTTDDYSVRVCDGYRWTLRLYSGNKTVCKLKGTVEPPPNGKDIANVLKKIIPKDYFYVF